MKQTPLWHKPSPKEAFARDSRTITGRNDVLVVGAGIAGLTTAYLLQKEGYKVVVVDKGEWATGDTSRTTAHLTVIPDTPYSEFVSLRGEETAKKILNSKRAALRTIETLARDLQAPCAFRTVPGFIFTENVEKVASLDDEYKTLRSLGVECKRVDNIENLFPVKGAIRIEGQAQFHPLQYLATLVRAFREQGGIVIENAQVIGFDEGDECRVRTTRGTFVGDRLVICTHVPIDSRFSLQTKLASYRTYAVAVKVDADIAEDLGLFWDTEDPYHYIRAVSHRGNTLLIVGGKDHKTGIPPEDGENASIRALREYAYAHFPVKEISFEWSGQVVEPVDGLPYLGSRMHKSNVFVSTGFAGNGMTFGTLGALLIRDEILGRENEWSTLYTPSRLPSLRQSVEYVRENKDFPYHLLKDRIAKADNLDDIAPGEGGIVKENGRTVALYKGMDGSAVRLDARCPHMGCLVGWNTYEKSWDCPCHGSRFACTGEILNGPAYSNLPPVCQEGGGEGQGDAKAS